MKKKTIENELMQYSTNLSMYRNHYVDIDSKCKNFKKFAIFNGMLSELKALPMDTEYAKKRINENRYVGEIPKYDYSPDYNLERPDCIILDEDRNVYAYEFYKIFSSKTNKKGSKRMQETMKIARKKSKEKPETDNITIINKEEYLKESLALSNQKHLANLKDDNPAYYKTVTNKYPNAKRTTMIVVIDLTAANLQSAIGVLNNKGRYIQDMEWGMRYFAYLLRDEILDILNHKFGENHVEVMLLGLASKSTTVQKHHSGVSELNSFNNNDIGVVRVLHIQDKNDLNDVIELSIDDIYNEKALRNSKSFKLDEVTLIPLVTESGELASDKAKRQLSNVMGYSEDDFRILDRIVSVNDVTHTYIKHDWFKNWVTHFLTFEPELKVYSNEYYENWKTRRIAEAMNINSLRAINIFEGLE